VSTPAAGAPRRGDRAATALIALIVGFIVALALAGQASRSRAAEGRRVELARIAATRQARTASLEDELAQLRSRADRLSSTGASNPLRTLNNDLTRFGLLAGTAPARGGGLVVTLADSPLASKDPTASLDFRIQDIDIQLVVNELWQAGAEAIAVNGQRLVGTTAIRTAGDAILVNFKVLSSPYRVEAIGAPETMERHFKASEVAERFTKWTDLYRLGFSVKTKDALRIPAYSGALRFQYARPAKD
jgi:uncharacterized protein YlxW (UPF0749 family)